MVGPVVTLPNRVVFRDKKYADGTWITSVASDQLAQELARRGFTVLDALGLKSWFDKVILDRIAATTVVVFAQDIVPKTVAEVRGSQATIVRYLREGGNVIWAGDVPFWWVAHPKSSVVSFSGMPFNQYFREEWNLAGPFACLGLPVAVLDFEATVERTKAGNNLNLLHDWLSSRPVPVRNEWLSKDDVLAWARLPPRISIDDVLPQRIWTDVLPERLHALSTMTNVLVTVVSLLSALFVSLVTVLGLSGLFGLQASVAAAVGSGVAVGIIVWFAPRAFKAKFASGWIRRFPSGGKFVRVWDSPYIDQVTGQMIDDLVRLSESALQR